MYNLLVFSMFTMLCNDPHCLIPDNFLSPQQEIPYLLGVTSSFLLPTHMPRQPLIYFLSLDG